jgi:hypothetical protein
MKFSTQNLLSIREWQTHAEVPERARRVPSAHDKVVRSMRLFAEKVIPKVA